MTVNLSGAIDWIDAVVPVTVKNRQQLAKRKIAVYKGETPAQVQAFAEHITTTWLQHRQQQKPNP